MSPNNHETASETPPVEAGTVLVTEKGEGLAQILADGRHRFLADEPLDHGGQDEGPSPYELLLMSLGACTSMTLRLYATRKGWPLERIRIRLKHKKISDGNGNEPGEKPVLIDHIERHIELSGPLDDAQRKRLLEIAGNCPVHRTLSSAIRIDTSASIA